MAVNDPNSVSLKPLSFSINTGLPPTISWSDHFYPPFSLLFCEKIISWIWKISLH